MESESEVARSCSTHFNPYQAPPSMEFSRQEYWSGLPFPDKLLTFKLAGANFLVCSWERAFLLGKTKVYLVKVMVFPVVMYGCKSWTIKKAERRRTELLNCGVEKTLESPLNCQEIKPVNRKGNQF